MSWDTVQNASAVTEIVSTGFKVLGYSLVTVCSVIGADYIKGDRGKERRLQKMINQWRVVLSRLSEDHKRRIALESPHMLESATITLDEYVRIFFTFSVAPLIDPTRNHSLEQRLYMLSIRSRKSSIWSRLVGKHAAEARTIEHLLQKLDEDLQGPSRICVGGQGAVDRAMVVRDRDVTTPMSEQTTPATPSRDVLSSHLALYQYAGMP
ncbi:hypothetical protein C8Q77DRAFT_1070204 [Trametes polyzona]|nr:hypothetical protein C8Q77DRAFT_1070204 [Trametes polyzona]